MPPETETFAACLERLAKERRLTRMAHDAWDPDVEGTSAATLVKVRKGTRLPNPPLIEAVADLEKRSPADFPEYALAKARRTLEGATRLLDEHAYGLETATTTLRAVSGPIKALEGNAALAPPGELGRDLAESQTTDGSRPRRKPPKAADGSQGSKR